MSTTHSDNEAIVRVFPRWLSRRVGVLAEMEANPLYAFLSGQAYGRRSWWRLGARKGRLTVGVITRVRPLLTALMVFLGVVFLLSFVTVLFAVVCFLAALAFWAGGLGSGSIGAYTRSEHKAGRLDALLLTHMSSRDWAVGWIGTRQFRNPRSGALAVVGLMIIWPVLSLVLLRLPGLDVGGDERYGFVLKPSVAIAVFLVLLVMYRVGSEVVGVSLELETLGEKRSLDQKALDAFVGVWMKGLYLFGAWGLPAVVGLTMAAVGGFWVFLGIFAVVSALVQWAFIRPHWRKLEVDFLPLLSETLQLLEESKGGEEEGGD